MSTKSWFYCDPQGSPLGPYDVVALQGLISNGYVTKETHLWAEGCAEWLKLSEIHELKHLVRIAEDVKKATKKLQDPGDELAAFEAEIKAIEEAAASEDPDATEGPATPEDKEFEDDDGTIYVWDSKLRKYVEKNAEDQEGYSLEEMMYAGDDEIIPSLAAAKAAVEALDDDEEEVKAERKRKSAEAGPLNNDAAAGDTKKAVEADKGEQPKAKKQKGQKQEQQQPQAWFELKNNTSVYVTGLPRDVTTEEIVEVFSKYGLIKEYENKQPRIKIYRDKESGEPKGDALITYLKEPSVDLCINLLDGTQFRFGMKQNMTVTRAQFEMKGEQFIPKQSNNKNSRKVQLEKLEKKLGWGGFDDKLPATKVTVILKHMFDPTEMQEELMLAEELEQDVLAECTKLGPVEKVRVYKNHPEGVVTVKFKTEEGVAQCLKIMNGRFFGGRRLEADMWDGVTNYHLKVQETAEEQQARLEAFAKELEGK